MLKVTIATEGEKLSLSLTGHAGYAEQGKDIVCASASILVSTLAHNVALLDRFNAFKEPAVVRLESGDTEITCVVTDSSEHIRRDFYFAGIGLALLAGNYPQCVDIYTDAEAE